MSVVAMPSTTVGRNGRTIIEVTSLPTITVGRVGDYAIRAFGADTILYGPKTAAGWPPGRSLRGTRGNDGAVLSRVFTFDAGTTDADPGDGNIRLNNTAASATVVYADNQDADGGNAAAFLDAMDDSTTPLKKGRLELWNADRSASLQMIVTGSVVVGTGYRKIPVSVIGVTGTFESGDELHVLFTPTGDLGQPFLADTDALRALEKGSLVAGQAITAADVATFGSFVWDDAATDADDGGLCLEPDEGGTGRWKRVVTDGMIEAKWYGLPLTAASVQAAIDAALAGGFAGVRLPPGQHTLGGDITIANLPSSTGPRFTVEAYRTEFLGAQKLIIDGVKRLSVEGLTAGGWVLAFRGTWFSQFPRCTFDWVELGDAAGTYFDSNYWNSFPNSVVGKILSAGYGPHNVLDLRSTAIRGDATQGPATEQDYSFEFVANTTCEQWLMQGGDISYPAVDVYFIDPANTSVVDLTLRNVYFDQKVARPLNRAKTRIVVDNCWSSNDKLTSQTLAAAAKGSMMVFDIDEGTGWEASSELNFVPNGDLSGEHAGFLYNSDRPELGGPISFANGATISEGVNTLTGRHINIDQPATTSNSVVFKTTVLPMTGKYTRVFLLRNADETGAKTIRGEFGGLTRDYIVQDDWTLCTLTVDAVTGGVEETFNLFTSDSTAFNIDVAYVGVTLGDPGNFLPGQRPFSPGSQARAANTWWLLDGSAVAVSHTGDVINTELARVTIPAGSVGANGMIKITALFSRNASGANTANAAVSWDSIAGTNISGTGIGTSFLSWESRTIVAAQGSEASQVYLNADEIKTAQPVSETTRDLSGDIDLVFHAKLDSAADTVTLRYWSVEILYRK